MVINIDRDAVLELLTHGAQIVEVLPAEEYDAEHLPGAINIPLKELDREHAAPLERDRPIVVYCNDFQ